MSFLVNEEQWVKNVENWKIGTKFTNCSGVIFKVDFLMFSFCVFYEIEFCF